VSPVAPALDAYLTALRAEVQEALERVLAALAPPAVIADPIRYALIAPGKRLRPCLTLTAAESVGVARGLDPGAARALARPAACAVEMVHTYSLVHDDLPAMDDDALRRGRPTTHVVFGDGLAILAGDGLLTDAFTTIARSPSPAARPGDPEAPAESRLRAVATLAAAAGSVGMVGGQAIDLTAAGLDAAAAPTAAAAALEDMHGRKTGALIRAAAVMGAILSGGDDRQVAAIDAYARDLGLAFQIVDDVLDVEGSAADLGKTAGKDAAAGKLTFPALHGLDASRRMAADCVDRACAALADAGLTGRLDDIASWSLGRTR
jgi:geranylgeranyl pyrophosphate synthase